MESDKGTSESAADAVALSRSRAEQKAATRGRILSVATEMFAERDYGAVTVSDIAQRAGVAHGLVFHHFGSKQGLYRAVLDRVVEDMDSAFVAGAAEDPAEAIRAGLHAHLRYVAEHPALATRLITGTRSTDSDMREASEAGRERVLALLASHLGVDMHDGTVQLVGRTIVAAVDEASVNWVREGCRVPVDDLVSWLLELSSAAIRTATVLDPRLDGEAVQALVRADSSPRAVPQQG